jgi:hypothetical protein
VVILYAQTLHSAERAMHVCCGAAISGALTFAAVGVSPLDTSRRLQLDSDIIGALDFASQVTL